MADIVRVVGATTEVGILDVPDFIMGGYWNVGALTSDNFLSFGSLLFAASETDMHIPIPEDAILSNYTCYVRLNTSTGTADKLHLRLNGSDGNGEISITAGGTGKFEDASNTDAVSQTDNIIWRFEQLSTSTSVRIHTMGCEVS